ncbi:MAG: glycosyltransferase [Photobacterium frigidiphilum]|uniref:glycosyltransferase n=1 Tax=Photobacterium frigidiphilum TaxID=264736 RepID=UPI003002DE83
MSNKVLINASNLHHGGGVQVAASLIYGLSEIEFKDTCFYIVASSKVIDSLPSDFNFEKFELFKNINISGLLSYNKEILNLSSECDCSLTVFGPSYFMLRSKVNIVGFAQPWIIYPNNILYENLSLINVIKNKFKFFIQKIAFKRSDYLVVEHQHVKNMLGNRGFTTNDIFVINNTVSAPFIKKDLRRDLDVPKMESTKVLGFVGRAYPHKNLEVLKSVSAILLNKYKINISFLFTLTNEEMATLGFDDLANFYSCGPIDNTQCPNFFNEIDALIFPSLLECFSATPLESMIMSKPVFASDLSFIRDVYGESVYYFDPLNPEDIAKVISDNIFNENELKTSVESGFIYSKSFPTARQRAIEYIKIVDQVLD